ncbi:MOSC domain-containing protein [Actinoalloteichus hymeniacidonis]|uniref:MOSC domain-containing protein n=1 Tax=Actinoalloteichus hymeniacidonis TaxID=340345 RepID=A0AAC9N019_9PSEU|nr:MOSC domain-containing protein [Actinoalloteichus hymeniacidonis]AOS65084.1 hypothetical protein TL08_21485 [Actinoalloteichus hymeniacidonis]MBB5906837.1 MOSC domain-containing protein YiiM [Actinoalloteichus hymeniacidonis]
MSTVSSVNLAMVHTADWAGKLGSTGIDKRPASGRIRIESTGVTGDTVVNKVDHGRWFQAVYAFDSEDLAHWSSELGMELTPGKAGENLTTSEIDIDDAVIGQRLRFGDAVLRVTGPRVPCQVFAGFWDVRGLAKKFTAHGRPGTYLAVEEPGEVWAGAPIEVLSTPEHGVTVAEVFAVSRGRRYELSEHVAQALDDLPPEWAEEVRTRIALGAVSA